MEVELHSFLTVALHEVEWSASCLGCLTSAVYKARLTPEPLWMFREKLMIWVCQEAVFFSALQNAGKVMHIHGH